MSLAFEIGARGGVADIRLNGRIDRDAGTVLEDAYTAAVATEPSAIEVDFTRVDYINSTGIALIVGFLARARAHALPIRASGLTEHYVHVFEITRLSDFLEIVEPTKA